MPAPRSPPWSRPLISFGVFMLLVTFLFHTRSNGSIQHSTISTLGDDDADVSEQTKELEDELEELTKDDSEDEKDTTPQERGEAQEDDDDERLDAGVRQRLPECATSRRPEKPGVRGGPRVQYVHVPKAGGTSIQAGLLGWSDEASQDTEIRRFDLNAYGGTSTKCPSFVKTATILIGHRGFGFCRAVKESSRGLFTFTALRNPVSRMVSLYDYNLQKLQVRRSIQVFGSTGASLSTLVKRYYATKNVTEVGEMLLRYAGSQQTRFMCGYECMGPDVYGHKDEMTEEYMLQRAKENLRKMDVVGITEKLDQLINLLRFHLTWVPKNFVSWPRDNVLVDTKFVKSELDEESRRILEEWSWTDRELYKEALEINEEKRHIANKCFALWRLPKVL